MNCEAPITLTSYFDNFSRYIYKILCIASFLRIMYYSGVQFFGHQEIKNSYWPKDSVLVEA